MKKGIALKVMKRHGIVPKNMSLLYFSAMKNVFCPRSTWRQWCQHLLMLRWLDGKAPDEGTYIPELNTHWGGTLTVDTR